MDVLFSFGRAGAEADRESGRAGVEGAVGEGVERGVGGCGVGAAAVDKHAACCA